jgi:hypothetical protein
LQASLKLNDISEHKYEKYENVSKDFDCSPTFNTANQLHYPANQAKINLT